MVLWLRSAIFNLFFYFWTILVSVVCLPMLLMPYRIAIKPGAIWATGTMIGARLLCGLRYEIRGKEYLVPGKAIIACKHQSAWETVIFYLLCPYPVYVLKKELSYLPLFGWYTILMKHIIVDRSAGASALKSLVKQSLDRLNRGRQIVIFPEGTRTAPGKSGTYQSGIAAIYNKADTPVTPVALNSGSYWGKSSFIKHPGTIVLEFLPPIPPGLSKKDFMQQLEERIEAGSSKLK